VAPLLSACQDPSGKSLAPFHPIENDLTYQDTYPQGQDENVRSLKSKLSYPPVSIRVNYKSSSTIYIPTHGDTSLKTRLKSKRSSMKKTFTLQRKILQFSRSIYQEEPLFISQLFIYLWKILHSQDKFKKYHQLWKKKNCQGWSRAIAIYLLRPSPVPILLWFTFTASTHIIIMKTEQTVVWAWIQFSVYQDYLFEWPEK